MSYFIIFILIFIHIILFCLILVELNEIIILIDCLIITLFYCIIMLYLNLSMKLLDSFYL